MGLKAKMRDVDYCATRRANAKWIQVLNSSCQICLETRWTNLLIVVDAFKVRGENRQEWEFVLAQPPEGL